MMRFLQTQLSRRGFLKGGAALVVGTTAAGRMAAAGEAAAADFASDFVRIDADGTVTVVVKHVEAGQGPSTGLATLVADEMNADWSKVRVAFAPADNTRYANLLFGVQGTGGSTAMANSFVQYRQAGAVALARLKAAAGEAWGVAPESIEAQGGVLRAGDKSASFGEMAQRAAQVPAPLEEPVLKERKDFVYIGREGLRRKDIDDKVVGRATFALDYRPDNVLYAVIARSPKFGGTLTGFDDAQARKVGGFAGASRISPAGVAVYAESQWAAIKARRALKTTWDFAAAETRSSDKMLADYRKALDEPGLVVRDDGDAAGALNSDGSAAEATLTFPFLAHAPMEPLNCTIQMRDGRVTLWDGCQFPGTVKPAVAQVVGVKPEMVDIVSLYAGGTFGRRATPVNDYQVEAAQALMASPDRARPLKVAWTREDDIRGGWYRPMFAHRVRASVDAQGNIAAWEHKLAGKSILIGTPFEAYIQNGIDNSSVEGISNLAYSVPNLHVDLRNMQESPVPVLWWRSVGHTHTAFAVETMVDMLAEKAGADPVEFRLRHLASHSRHAGVLRAAAEAAGWGSPPPAGRFRGVAVHESFSSYVAQVAEIAIDGKGAVKVEKITCAVDCGIAINPNIIRAQMEGGIGYGLGAAMRNRITLAEGGEVVESNFPDYRPLRMSDMPHIETVIVPSDEQPTGAGEPGTPPVAPALANAIHAATGTRVFDLPFADHGVKFA